MHVRNFVEECMGYTMLEVIQEISLNVPAEKRRSNVPGEKIAYI
jgi:hypothetical protein